MKPIYLDYNATTPVDPRVLEAMLHCLREKFDHPSSGHVYGAEAQAVVEHARARMAALLGYTPGENIFTGCGSAALSPRC